MQNDALFQENQIGHHVATIFDELVGFTYFVKDVELRYVAFNQRLLQIFGVKDGTEILGKKDDDFMPAHIMKSIREDDIRVLETGTFHSSTQRWVEWAAFRATEISSPESLNPV